ncbi:IkappaB kinase complex, IKAP component [Pluteus cervinus]|uniref:IkappaB kinase complex, IKAP component n=1 Tax=Pluteus cervinus TaxID=181527 RepID=A0ACD3AK46_9AGAR|nr:IkappaB kinase complex, IKAP component [Pluteus cervinus]
MRNLAVLSQTDILLEYLPKNARITATTIDLDENVLYAASESVNKDAKEVSVDVYKIEGDHATPINMFTCLSYGEYEGGLHPEIVLMHFMPEVRKVGFFMRGGDIVTIGADGEDVKEEFEGTVEPGILAASWNPDDSVLVLVTASFKLLLMTTTFDTLSEAPLHTSDFGEDAPINVGWGSKQTQFHGSLGKAAAQAPKTTVVGSSPDDDYLPRITWRGDAAYFVISALSPPPPPNSTSRLRRRILRVYDREGRLQTTSEDVGGLECSVAWRPSGNLIASTQRFGGFDGAGVGREGRHDVIFFERNGLRHGEFSLFVGRTTASGKEKAVNDDAGGVVKRRWGYRVKELGWNADSTVLSIWVEHDEADVVQLWTTGNYHWYLKQEIWAPKKQTGEPARFTSLTWHPEQVLVLRLTTTSQIITRAYKWETYASLAAPPTDSGSVAVIDGAHLLFTPFRLQNIPPPMSSSKITLFGNTLPNPTPQVSESDLSANDGPWRLPIHLAFSAVKDFIAVLWERGQLEIWDLKTRVGTGPRGKVMDPTLVARGSVFVDGSGDGDSARQVEWGVEENSVIVLVKTSNGDEAIFVEFTGEEGAGAEEKARGFKVKKRSSIPQNNGRLVVCAGPARAVSWYDPDGSLCEYNDSLDAFTPTTAKFPLFCPQTQRVSSSTSHEDAVLYVGFNGRGKLYASTSGQTKELGTNVTSFTIASGFVIYTTNAHEVLFAPISAIVDVLIAASASNGVHEDDQFTFIGNAPGNGIGPKGTTGNFPEWEKRRVERGSRIVVAVPSAMALVLQMPRGNLETISPRPLVMEVVKQDLNGSNYRKAFFSCRKHRIDLNVLVAHNETKFLEDIAVVVEQIHEMDHINLLLTNIGRGTLSSEAIARLCDAIRVELERIDLKKYVNSVLTAYVVKRPPDYEAALSVLHRLRENEQSVVEEAVKYVIFLADADRLFDVALGMYDFSLVLMIAQYAQKDPREYLPFLRELRALDKYYQRFKIDDHLKRRESALKNLSLAAEEKFDEATAYIEQYQLYEVALKIWKETEKYGTILDLYGDWLYDRREFRQAALVFCEAKKLHKAMISHEKGLEWREMFNIALDVDVSKEDVEAMAYRIADDLISKKRFAEAARVYLDYVKNVRQAVISLVEGNLFSEARRVAKMNLEPGLLEEIIHPGALDSRAQIAEDLREMQEQLDKQRSRLRELRVKKVEEPDAFYNMEDPTLHNVDVMTDASMPATVFTRYTAAPTSASRTSKRSSRSKRKLERKVGSGKKGTVDEEEYLLRSVTKLVGRFSATRDETKNLLPHLFQFTEEHRREGLRLQGQITRFEQHLEEVLKEIWAKSDESGGAVEQEDTFASRMEEKERNRKIDPLDRVSKPEFGVDKDWRVGLYEVL